MKYLNGENFLWSFFLMLFMVKFICKKILKKNLSVNLLEFEVRICKWWLVWESKCCKMCILESVGKYKIGYKCGMLWIKFYM